MIGCADTGERIRALRHSQRVRAGMRETGEIAGLFDGAVRCAGGEGAGRGGGAELTTRSAVGEIVVDHDCDIDIATAGMDKVVAADSESVAVTLKADDC